MDEATVFSGEVWTGARAKELGIELERVKPQLDRVLDEWAKATEVLDTLVTDGS